MPSRRTGIALIALVLILGFVNWSIAGREKHLSQGRIVYLKLAPVDPRSMMQGDYMALRFGLANQVRKALPKKKAGRGRRRKVAAADGYLVVSLDERNIGSFNSIYTDQALLKMQVLMRCRVRGGEVKFATNAFFFQEGHGDLYQPARYGQFRVDDTGDLLLVALYDENLKKLPPNAKV